MKIKKLTKTLCEAFGPSGDEAEVSDLIIDMIKPYVDSVSTDVMGNLIAFKKGETNKKIMISAHMDEIGLMVTHIQDSGMLKVAAIGGVSPIKSLNRFVISKNGTNGVVINNTKKAFSDLKLKDLLVDIGVDTKEEAEKQIRVGDCLKFKTRYVELNNRLAGAVMDNRICCAALVKVIEELESNKDDVYFVFSSQEEVGLRGATTASYAIKPDVGIAFDITIANAVKEDGEFTNNLSEGATIKIKDRSLICNPNVINFLETVAKENNIKTQREILVYGGTDAGAMQKTATGALAGAVSIPCKYVHSQTEMIDFDDVKNSINLFKAALKKGY